METGRGRNRQLGLRERRKLASKGGLPGKGAAERGERERCGVAQLLPTVIYAGLRGKAGAENGQEKSSYLKSPHKNIFLTKRSPATTGTQKGPMDKSDHVLRPKSAVSGRSLQKAIRYLGRTTSQEHVKRASVERIKRARARSVGTPLAGPIQGGALSKKGNLDKKEEFCSLVLYRQKSQNPCREDVPLRLKK